jgi:Na+-driven multidrug efflux pump
MNAAIQKFRNLFSPIDLTKGKIMPVLLRFMIPIILSILFQQIYTLTDTIIVGQTLNNEEIAGINASGSLVFIILDFALGCTSGFSVVISEAKGKNDEGEVRRSYLVGIILSFIIAVIMTIVGILLIPTMLGWLNIVPSTIDAAMQREYDAAYTYVLIIFIGIFAQLFYNLIVSVLRALGDSFTPFLFLVFSTILNIVLDLVFIISCHFGVAGAAWATVLSQSIAAIGCFLYAYLRYKNLRIRKEDWHFTWKFIYQHLRLGVPLGFQFSILAIGIIIMQAAIISFDRDPSGLLVAGTPAQLGYGAANKLVNLLMTPLNALGTGMLSFTGQNYGAKDYGRIKKGLKASLLLGLILWGIIIVLGLSLSINGAYQYVFFSADKINASSIGYGNMYIYISVPTMGFLMVLFIFRNVLQGLQKPLWPFLAGIGELIARSVICLYLPLIITKGAAVNSTSGLGAFAAVCAADPLAWLIATLIMSVPLFLAFHEKKPKKDDKTSN